ncbi:MAG TPA: CapA family protein [Candidatus Limnocylindrales bacterium]|nr:CapA family protein [Candidatus Limnocylindrales bacterium]
MQRSVETLQVLDRSGIAHAGAGSNLSAAQAPAFLTAKGVRIGIVAFADYPLAWAATATSPGINYTPISTAPEDFAKVEHALEVVRQQADLVLFSIHWGPNMRSRPTKAFRDFAHKVITAGADLFWGHSAHLVQGIEFYQGKPILYDTGDFIDDYAVDPEERNDLSALFLVRARPPHIENLELIPVQISNEQVNLAEGEEYDWFAQRITTLCAEMGTKVITEPRKLSLVVPLEDREGKVAK